MAIPEKTFLIKFNYGEDLLYTSPCIEQAREEVEATTKYPQQIESIREALELPPDIYRNTPEIRIRFLINQLARLAGDSYAGVAIEEIRREIYDILESLESLEKDQ